VPLQLKQQTGLSLGQLHDPPAACTGELRSCAEPIANAKAINAIVRNLLMVDLLCGDYTGSWSAPHFS
jgi:hypothetical protein